MRPTVNPVPRGPEERPETKLRRFKRPPVKFQKTAAAGLGMDEVFQLDNI